MSLVHDGKLHNFTPQVCVPFHSDGGVRDDLWKYTLRTWVENRPDWSIVTADVPDGTGFSRAASRNRAAHAAMAGTSYFCRVLVFADADTVFLDKGEAVEEAVRMADVNDSMVFAHDVRWMYGRRDTASMLSHGVMAGDDEETTGPHYNTFSGIFAISTNFFRRLGGYDERFVGWGFEDLAFMHAASLLGKVERVSGATAHLWHPRSRSEEEEGPNYQQNLVLWSRYVDARSNGDVVAMEELVRHGR